MIWRIIGFNSQKLGWTYHNSDAIWIDFSILNSLNRSCSTFCLAAPPAFATRVGSNPGVWVTRSRLFCNFSGVRVGVTPFPKRVNSRRLCDFHDKLCDLHDGLREMMMSRNLLCKSWKLSWKSRNLLESTPESQLQPLESDSELES